VSLFSVAERLAAIDRSTVVLDTQQCLHSRVKFSSCEECFAVCPVDAIQPGKPPEIDNELCQNCLACLPVCPVGAYTADDSVSSLLNCISRLEGSSVELVCEVHNAADKGVIPDSVGIQIRGCLASLGSGTFLALAALGLEQIILRTDACAQCPWKSLHEKIKEQVDEAQRLLSPWQETHWLSIISEIDTPVERPLWNAESPPLSRRDLFRMAARQGQVAIARAMTMERTKVGKRPGRDRLRIAEAISHFPQNNVNLDLEINVDGFTELSASEMCNACQACVQVCPTNSLRFEKDTEEKYYWLKFLPQTCIGCELCIHVCAPKAIEKNPRPTYAKVFFSSEPITINEGELARCDRCSTLFASRSGSKLCPVCEYRRENPFSSIIPPEIKNIVAQSKGKAPHDS
jgi:ferredoxin